MSLLRARGKLFCAHFLLPVSKITPGLQYSFLADQSMTIFLRKMIKNNFYADDIQIRPVTLSQGSAQNREFFMMKSQNRENLWSQLSTELKNASPFLYCKRRISTWYFFVPERHGLLLSIFLWDGGSILFRYNSSKVIQTALPPRYSLFGVYCTYLTFQNIYIHLYKKPTNH